VTDDRGDIDVQHLVEADFLRSEVSAEELDTSGDVTRAWIDQETEDSFEINVELADVPDDRNVSSPLVEVWAHFTVREGDYHAAARLATPQSGEPVEGTYELYLDDAKTSDLAGDVDVDADLVTFRVPKPDVRDPGEGDELSSFHVTTHAPETQAALDYAPDADGQALPSLEDAERLEPTNLQLAAEARYGDTYAFQSFAEPDSRLSVDVTPESLEVEAGQQATFAVRVVNDADQAEEVSLTVANTPPGWSVDLSPSGFAVPAYGSQSAELQVRPADDAEGHQLVDIHLTGERGADKGASVSVVAVQAGSGSGSWSGDGGGSQNEASDPAGDEDDPPPPAADGGAERSEANDSASGDEAQEIPLLWPLASLLAVAVVALLARVGG
jgi:hypothetical protein